MYIDYLSWEEFDYKVSALYLDVNNPRIRYGSKGLNQSEIMRLLLRTEKIYELAKKISEEGYFVGEEPIICIENDKKVVLEGNRRIAALKLLQNPDKFLSTAKANTLKKNIAKNNVETDRKIRCYIAPNRLLANPIIYERHHGDTLHRWRTGNQYSFVAEMFYEDGLDISDICDVLNESKAKVLGPLKAYNLFYEGKEILEKEEGQSINISEFDITNLERFYKFDEGLKFLGIEFSPENGELGILIDKEEFEKRLLIVFNLLLDADRFSREFNTTEDKRKYISGLRKLHEIENADETKESKEVKSRTSNKRSNLDEAKKNIVTRKRARKKSSRSNLIIVPSDKFLSFNHEKLDELFDELKSLRIDRKYSFAVLLRTFLEQSLEHYLSSRNLLDDLSDYHSTQTINKNNKKVELLIEHIKGKYKVKEEIEIDPILKILKFNIDRSYSGATLKVMLDYVLKKVAEPNLEPKKYKILKDTLDRVKQGLDLTVHNLGKFVTIEQNRADWKHLEPLFDLLSETIDMTDGSA